MLCLQTEENGRWYGKEIPKVEYVQVNKYSRLYEFDPNKNYYNATSIEERMFCSFLKQYKWEKFKGQEYNSGKHHIYVIFNYELGEPIWVGFIHVLECDRISKKCIQEIHFLEENLFGNEIVFIHTINVKFFFRHKKYASYMVNIVKSNFLKKADLMVEATKKGKKFWPTVGFIKVQKTLRGQFMICPKGSE